MTDAPEKAPWLPPRWFIRLFWASHRAVFRITGGRIGLRPPKGNKYGMMRLHTVGRRSGAERIAMLGYYEDGPNVVTMAMNGWGDPEPAWWLNLQANPDVTIELPDGPRAVHGYAATGDERRRLWAKWAEIDEGLDGWAALRSRETAVVVFEPRPNA